MTTPLWVTDAADCFWRDAGTPSGFPRDLRRPIAMALPLAVVQLPRLRIHTVRDWLRRRGIPYGVHAADRGLMACLVARDGVGLLFVDGADPEDEIRFSVAHEAAHFIRDYVQPRECAVSRLGPSVIEVLDGHRPARVEERIDGLLARAHIGPFTHLMERGPGGLPGRNAIGRAEHEADALASELLAPAGVVMERLRGAGMKGSAAAAGLLMSTFGLPAAIASLYARELVPQVRGDSLLRCLWAVSP